MVGKISLIIALPFAGGNSYSYNFLKPLLPQEIILETLEYPGRGRRSTLNFVTQMDILIEDLLGQYLEITSRILPDKIIIYGHSVGAIIGVALLHHLKHKQMLQVTPEFAIFSGHGGPQQTIKRHLSTLPSEQLISYFQRIGSLPNELIADTELMDYILPILRNDLALYEKYESFYAKKLTLPLFIVNGKQDYISKKDIDSWEHETAGLVKFHELEGHHFFMSQYPIVFSELIVRLITGIVENNELYANRS